MTGIHGSTRMLAVLAVACIACTEPSTQVTEVDAPAFASAPGRALIVEVRDIRWASGKGFVVDVAVLQSIVSRAVRDVKSDYVIELSLTYANSAIMGDLPTVVLNLARTPPASSLGDFHVYQMTVPWDAMHNGSPVTGEVTAGYLANVRRYRKGAIDEIGQSSGTWLVVIA